MSTSKEIIAEIESITDIKKELYVPILDSLKTVFYAKKRAEETELGLREKECARQGLYKRDKTTLDIAKIKAKAMNGAIAVWSGEVDKIKELNEEKDEYISALKSGDIDNEEVKSLISQRESLAESNSASKGIIAELKVKASPEIIEALTQVAKEEILKIKEMEEIREGKEPAKKKNKSVLYDIFALLRKKLTLK